MTKTTTNLGLITYDTVNDGESLFYSFVEDISGSSSSNMTKLDSWIGSPHISGSAFTVGGLHVGGTSNPGVDNLIVDGKTTISGSLNLISASVIEISTAVGGQINLYNATPSTTGKGFYVKGTPTQYDVFHVGDTNSETRLLSLHKENTLCYFPSTNIIPINMTGNSYRHFRTFHKKTGEEFIYTGSAIFLSTNTFSANGKISDAADNTDVITLYLGDATSKPFITEFTYHAIVETTADASNYWCINLSGYHTPYTAVEECKYSTAIKVPDTDIVNTFIPNDHDDVILATGSFVSDVYFWGVSACKVGSPGALDLEAVVFYKKLEISEEVS